ncbi:hypothetical protein [Spirilliplanes yamanashiensis]|uniref:Secreted protein n=1 Tax=Spirilliplanes yamanashiensis TaxID=42233 RepID=A0A8J4DIA3_9ACTN|nr:hypothetical protein [Spirilliplanes yamanashiensis]MDP9814506.1 hypothetical protein [Spirilliplanes yamanashiensis]GIJ02159.1 hypothetical protein Sya03_15110 [Spirilliplanes yamanashiensis]
MNKWWYRTMGTVGVAGGFLLLSGAAAQADPGAPAQPQPLTGVLGGLLGPTDGLTGSLGGNPANGLMPGDDVVPGVVDGPYLVPPPTMETRGNVAGDAPAGRAATDAVDPAGLAGRLPAGPAASVVSPLAPATGGGVPVLGDLTGLLGGGLLPTGDLLSGGGVAPADQVPALIGDAMAARQPELFGAPGLLGSLPLLGGAAPAAPAAPAARPVTTLPADTSGMPSGGRHVAPEAPSGRAFSDGRPVAGEDTEYR